MGIGGDLPILLLECREGKDLSLVQLLLKAHAWYRMHGLWVDLVLAVTQPSGYGHPLRERLGALAQSCHSHAIARAASFDTAFGTIDTIEKSAGIYLRARAANGGNEPSHLVSDDQLRAICVRYGLHPDDDFLE